MLDKFTKWFSNKGRDADLDKQLEALRQRTPVPVFWLFGKTQSGKTTIIKYLTGAEEAEIGHGFRPCTRFSRQYEFPTAEAPLLTFLDTRGMDEPGYDVKEDLARFDSLAHVVLVTVKVTDHGLENVVNNLRAIRRSQPGRPVVLALTCLHEAYPQQQHPQPYDNIDWDGTAPPGAGKVEPPPAVRSLVTEHRRRFEGLVDHLVALDLTQPEEGYDDPEYGGHRLKEVLLEALPGAFRQTLLTLDQATGELQDLYARHALPHILGYSSMAAAAGAIPIPGVDLLIVPGIQSRMIYHLAEFYGQPLSAQRFMEMASSLGLGLVVRQAARQVAKFIPGLGSVAGAALAFGGTFALGKAFCYYYSAVHRGHAPQPEELKRYYRQQLAQAEELWKKKKAAAE